MVTVFKTNVSKHTEAKRLVNYLLEAFPGSRVNIDLQDCDKVLRVEAETCLEGKIISLVQQTGFTCSPLL